MHLLLFYYYIYTFTLLFYFIYGWTICFYSFFHGLYFRIVIVSIIFKAKQKSWFLAYAPIRISKT